MAKRRYVAVCTLSRAYVLDLESWKNDGVYRSYSRESGGFAEAARRARWENERHERRKRGQ